MSRTFKLSSAHTLVWIMVPKQIIQRCKPPLHGLVCCGVVHLILIRSKKCLRLKSYLISVLYPLFFISISFSVSCHKNWKTVCGDHGSLILFCMFHQHMSLTAANPYRQSMHRWTQCLLCSVTKGVGLNTSLKSFNP